MDNERKESIEKIAETIQLEKVENLIKDGCVEVVVREDETKYRLRIPSMAELNEVSKFKSETFTGLLQNEKILCIKQIVSCLKKRGIISEEEVKGFEKNQDLYRDTMIEMAQVKTEDKDVLISYGKTIQGIVDDMKLYLDKIKTYISNSLEILIKSESDSYLCFICGEKLEDNKWVSVWKVFDEFKNDKKRALPFFMRYSENQGDALDFISGGWQGLLGGE